MAANLPFIIKALLLVGYFAFSSNRTPWASHFVYWAWLPFVVHVYLHHFMDGLQNTTRNLARIWLIQNHGPRYPRRLVEPIQMALIPDSLFPAVMLWVAVNVGGFCLLLFLQGWATALIADFALMLFGGFIPIGYTAHLKRVRDSIGSVRAETVLALAAAGVSLQGLAYIATRALREGRDPQQWWGAVLRDAIEEDGRG